MIAFRGRGRLNGRSSFRDGVAYVRGIGREDAPLAVWSEGVSALDSAAFEMDAVRAQSRSGDSLYHLILSYAPGEEPDFEQARFALVHVLGRLGLEEHQYVAALQNDGESGMWHVHAIVNLVHPIRHRRASIRGDFYIMREAVREVERADGWRVLDSEDQPRSLGRDHYGARQRFAEYLRREVAPEFQQMIESGRASWDGVRAWLQERGIAYEVVSEYGARLVGQASGWVARVKELGYSHKDLLERLGRWRSERAADREARVHGIEVRLAEIRKELGALENQRSATWNDVHALFEARGLEYRRSMNGARVVELEGPGYVRIARSDALAFASLAERFGSFVSSKEAEARALKRAAVERLEDLVRASALAKDPTPFLDTVFTTESVVSRKDLEKALVRDVKDDEFRQAVREAVAERLVVVRNGDELGFTTPEIAGEEEEARAAARSVAARKRTVSVIRPAVDRMDEQQRNAYAYATADGGSLRVVTGVPGAGKTFLIREIAEAYREAGMRVRAVSVANSAVQVLREETGLPSRSVKAELVAWQRGEEVPLSSRDVIIIDELSTLGTADARALLREAERAGAVILGFGDDKQFEGVARGSGLRIMQEALDGYTVDMEQTRRQVLDQSDANPRWMRDATEAARRGDVRDAMQAYASRGKMQGFKTNEDARYALVMEWAWIESTGRKTIVETFTNKERRQLNHLIRAAHREMGRLKGRDVVLETMDGKTPYAVGDRVTVRETVKSLGLVNGSNCVVRGVRGSTLTLERADGERVDLDTRQHPGVQHGYAVSEYRAQGATYEACLQFFTRQVNQRSVTVGLTRHTHEYGGFYSDQEFRRGFEGVVELAERNRSKTLVRDCVELGRGREAVARFTGRGVEAQERVAVELVNEFGE